MAFNEQRFKEIQDEWRKLAAEKNHDYGGANITMTEISGVVTRMVDKAYRLTRVASGIEPNFEDIVETLRDLSNYGVIGAMVQEGSWEAKQPTKLVYLAGPIDAVSSSEAAGWRDQIARMLGRSRITCFNPCAAFYNGSLLSADRIRSINRSAIDSCDAVIARLDQFAMSVGTQREIEYAKSTGKRVIAWISNDRWKGMLELHDVELVYTAEGAANAILGADFYFDSYMGTPVIEVSDRPPDLEEVSFDGITEKIRTGKIRVHKWPDSEPSGELEFAEEDSIDQGDEQGC